MWLTPNDTIKGTWHTTELKVHVHQNYKESFNQSNEVMYPTLLYYYTIK